MSTQVMPDALAPQTILPVLSSKPQVFWQFGDFTTLNSVEILNSLGQEMNYVRWHPVMLNASMQRQVGLVSDTLTLWLTRVSPKNYWAAAISIVFISTVDIFKFTHGHPGESYDKALDMCETLWPFFSSDIHKILLRDKKMLSFKYPHTFPFEDPIIT